jgi:hypothetical protein
MESSDETTLAPYSYWYCPPEGKSSSRPRQFQISRLREVTSSKKHFVCKGVRRQPVQALARTGPELKHHLEAFTTFSERTLSADNHQSCASYIALGWARLNLIAEGPTCVSSVVTSQPSPFETMSHV